MKFIIKEIVKLRRSILGKYYRLKSSFIMWLEGGKLSYGNGVIFAVPTIFNGLGAINIGDNTRFGYLPANVVGDGVIKIQARSNDAVVTFDEDCICSGNLTIIANQRVSIGKGCLIGDMVSVMDCDFHDVSPLKRHESGVVAPVEIGDNVWLGARVIILKGVVIGDNTVIAAGSVVSKSLPSNVVAGGVPAKVLKSLDY